MRCPKSPIRGIEVRSYEGMLRDLIIHEGGVLALFDSFGVMLKELHMWQLP